MSGACRWTDRPDGKRWGGWVFSVIASIAYFGAYYATYTMPHGILFGTPPHYHYSVGPWELPNNVAHLFFAPAHWIDVQTIHRGSGD